MNATINRLARLSGKLLADGSKATLNFFKHEFPEHVKNKQPEAMVLLSVMGHEALQVAEGVIEKNPVKVLSVVPQFIGAKWAYMGYEYKNPITKIVKESVKKENHPFIKDSAHSLKTDFGNYMRGKPSLLEGYVEGKGINPQQYAKRLVNEFAPMAQRTYNSMPENYVRTKAITPMTETLSKHSRVKI
jgi:hypothetical protein